MSVIVCGKVAGDTAKFQQAMIDRKDEFEAIAQRARSVGAIHHRFGFGDGYVLVVDEWESPQQFEAFFGDPKLQEFIGSVGGDTSTPPEFIIAEAVSSPDEF